MTEKQVVEELLMFFKALAEANRLKIIGLLAQQPCSVEKIAELLGIGVSTTSHHLSTLSKVGLVSARGDGHYFIYSLHTEVLEEMASRLLSKETLPSLSGSVDLDAYDRKVLKAFLDEDGRIKAFPAQEKKFQVLVRHVAQSFEFEKKYSEKEVNTVLSEFSSDTSTLRRGLIEYKYMARRSDGAEYWRIDPDQ